MRGADDRRAGVHERVEAGALRIEVPRVTWNRAATGQACAGCGAAIEEPDPQFECEFADDALLPFHPDCFAVWRDLVRARLA